MTTNRIFFYYTRTKTDISILAQHINLCGGGSASPSIIKWTHCIACVLLAGNRRRHLLQSINHKVDLSVPLHQWKSGNMSKLQACTLFLTTHRITLPSTAHRNFCYLSFIFIKWLDLYCFTKKNNSVIALSQPHGSRSGSGPVLRSENLGAF